MAEPADAARDFSEVVREFTHQAESFNRSPVMRSADTLDRLVDALPAGSDQLWLDAACGPGLVARALAPLVGGVVGVDLTPAMLEVARREAAHDGLGNVRFEAGDVTRLEFGDGTFDGALTRFSLHHIPLPGRVVSELARVTRPGGTLVVADHVTSDDARAAAWHQEIERLRDPSHWSCLTQTRIAELGDAAGLDLVRTEQHPFVLDFGEWLGRGSGGSAAADLIERSLRARTPHPPEFAVDADRRHLQLAYCLAIWRKPSSVMQSRAAP